MATEPACHLHPRGTILGGAEGGPPRGSRPSLSTRSSERTRFYTPERHQR